MTLVFLVTYKFGPVVSIAGAKYLSAAQSLVEGRGLYDYLNSPLTQFSPLYSILMAGSSLITGMDVFIVGQYLNILTFGVVIWLAGYFFYKIFPKEPLFSYFGSAIVATDVLETGTRKNILLMGLIAAISPFQRYAGLALIITGSCLLLFLFRKNFTRGVLIAGVFGVLTAFPIMSWVYFHNYIRTGILFGVRLPPVYLGNFQVTIEKMEHWLLPATLTN